MNKPEAGLSPGRLTSGHTRLTLIINGKHEEAERETALHSVLFGPIYDCLWAARMGASGKGERASHGPIQRDH